VIIFDPIRGAVTLDVKPSAGLLAPHEDKFQCLAAELGAFWRSRLWSWPFLKAGCAAGSWDILPELLVPHALMEDPLSSSHDALFP